MDPAQTNIAEDLINPLMIPRIRLAFYKINGDQYLNEGSKPTTELRKSQIAMRFLKICDNPREWQFYSRFSNSKHGANVERSTGLADLSELRERRKQLDQKVILNAIRARKVNSQEIESPRLTKLPFEAFKSRNDTRMLSRSHQTLVLQAGEASSFDKLDQEQALAS